MERKVDGSPTLITSEYRAVVDSPAREKDDTNHTNEQPISTILVQSAWRSGVSNPNEPTFRFGRPVDSLIDPFVWGGLYASSFPALQNNQIYDYRWFFYILGWFLSGGFCADWLQIRPWTPFIAGLCSFGIGLALYYYGVQQLDNELEIVAQDVNAVLAKAGYHVRYSVDRTGLCYSKERRFRVFRRPDGTLSTTRVLDALPPTTQASSKPLEPVILYLYSPWYRHFCSWSQPISFFNQEQPDELKSIHPFLWGALCDAFFVFGVENNTRIQRYDIIALLLLLGISGRGVLGVYLVFAVLLLIQVLFGTHLQADYSQNLGHERWTRALETWQPVLADVGWQLEYHRNDDQERFSSICCMKSSPDVFVRFVPINV